MNRKQIDASREARLWIMQVIVPIGAALIAIPSSRNWVTEKATIVGDKVKKVFTKEKGNEKKKDIEIIGFGQPIE